ncbi:phage membrane protein [Streptococcus equi subsp. zooepidemicus Sz105]|nr:phage membrane protein [Streptococcus equi subsp. zooepidemicus Sz5]KIS10435.1 phage membrane protein [Streptococcus equi subsp. zooepidemicus Sz16]KIS13214.1 phage membrane protein [Streptococcus equi subsp. zooepidemicus Sz105]
MRAITRLAIVIAITILYLPLSVIALIVYPFYVIFKGEDKW